MIAQMPFQYLSVFWTLFSPKNLIGFDIFLKMNEMVIVENWSLCQLIQNAALMFLYWIHILFSPTSSFFYFFAIRSIVVLLAQETQIAGFVIADITVNVVHCVLVLWIIVITERRSH